MTQKPKRQRRSFSDQFNRDAVDLITNQGYSFADAVQALNVGESNSRLWHEQLAPKPEPCGDDASLEELGAEKERPRQKLRRAEMEREILRKSCARQSSGEGDLS